MEPRELNALCAHINASLDIKEYIHFLDYHPEKAIKSQGLYRMLCPLHGETVFRTLVLNPRRNTAHCEHAGCEGHRPCDLIEMAMRIRREDRTTIVMRLLEFFGPERLQLTPSMLQQIRMLQLADRIDSAEAMPGSETPRTKDLQSP